MKKVATNNPDLYFQGTRVKLNADAMEQGLGRLGDIGTVVSRYPLRQIVAVKWTIKKSLDRFHVDLLDIVKSKRGKELS